MARKDLLKSLMAKSDGEARSPEITEGAIPRRTTGAIGAVSQSIAELKSRSIQEIDPNFIDNAGFADRLEQDPADHAALVASIREYGQQVPVLVRGQPEDPTRFQIVYGRRRVAALKELGQKVKAMVRDLNDHDLAIVQGQENTARKDLSYIEKCNFARQLRDADYERKVICDALAVDKTQISRMLSVADAIAVPLIEAIGPAPKAGRDRWAELAKSIEGQDVDTLIALIDKNMPSDARFQFLLNTLNKAPAPQNTKAPPALRDHTAADGTVLAKSVQKTGKWVLTVDTKQDDGFAQWLAQNLGDLHRRYNDEK
jgi:ParB family chromosome partitioning protein